MEKMQNKFEQYIRDVPDFPKEGILFKDITPLLKDPRAFREVIDIFASRLADKKVDHIIAVEARGFILGSALSYALGVGFIPIRKEGKLPHETNAITYQLEYGCDTLEVHKHDIKPESRIVIIDDVLATGGTVSAVVSLLREMNCDILELAFLIELTFLNGRAKLPGFDDKIFSLITY